MSSAVSTGSCRIPFSPPCRLPGMPGMKQRRSGLSRRMDSRSVNAFLCPHFSAPNLGGVSSQAVTGSRVGTGSCSMSRWRWPLCSPPRCSPLHCTAPGDSRASHRSHAAEAGRGDTGAAGGEGAGAPGRGRQRHRGGRGQRAEGEGLDPGQPQCSGIAPAGCARCSPRRGGVARGGGLHLSSCRATPPAWTWPRTWPRSSASTPAAP